MPFELRGFYHASQKIDNGQLAERGLRKLQICRQFVHRQYFVMFGIHRLRPALSCQLSSGSTGSAAVIIHIWPVFTMPNAAADKTVEAVKATADKTRDITGQAMEKTGEAMEKAGSAMKETGEEMQNAKGVIDV